MPIRVELVRSTGELGDLSDEWRKLLAESPQDNLFLTWEWLSTWWRYFGPGSQLFLLCVRDPDTGLIGLAPFRITHHRPPYGVPLRVIEFLGSGTPAWSDDLEVISARGREQEVLEAVGAYLLQQRDQWDVAQLTDLPERSFSVAVLSERLGAARVDCATRPWAVCPYLPLTDPWPVYEERARRKFRDLKKYLKALEQAGGQFGLVTSREMLELALEALVQLNQRRVQSKHDIPSLSNPTFGAFVKEFCRLALQLGWLRLYYIANNHDFIAINLNFLYGKRAYGYLSGFAPEWQRHGVGTSLFHYVIRDSYQAGVGLYDFLRGDEEYKYRWTSEERRTIAFRAVNRRGRYAAFRATEEATRLARKLWSKAGRLLQPTR